MTSGFWITIVLLVVGGCVSCATAQETFDPYHETPAEYDARSQWFRDAKFGVFVHWNPSATIGQEISWCRDKYGREKYDLLYKDFKGEKFNADEWVKLFHDAGIRYGVFVPKHHDGFAMFKTATYDYNVMNTPFGRDYIKEISAACERGGVKFCLYYSILDWWNPKYSKQKGADLSAYVNEVFKPHMKELLTQYGPVGCIWFDGNWEPSWNHKDARDVYGFARKLQPSTLLGNRIEPRPKAEVGPYCKWTGSFYDAPDAVGDYQAREVDLGKFYSEKVWDCCFSLCAVDHKWSWFPPMEPRPLSEVIGWLIQCIGRDGNMLLGVGPRPDGTIDPASAARLLEVGEWMKLYGDAVYSTRGGPFLPGSWGVSTRKGNRIFLFVTHWRGSALTLPKLEANVTSARLMTGGAVTSDTGGANWKFTVAEQYRRPIATIIELTVDQDVMKLTPVAVPEPRNLALKKGVEVSSIWEGRKELLPSHITDANPGTIWATEEQARSGWVKVDLGAEYTIEEVVLSDAPYGRITSFELSAQVGDQWQKLTTGKQIGDSCRLKFAPVKTRYVRMNILNATDTPTLADFQVYEHLAE